MADWLEAYAQLLELNVWTSVSVRKIQWDTNNKKWATDILRADGSIRHVQSGHLVFANGLGGGKAFVPDVPEKV